MTTQATPTDNPSPRKPSALVTGAHGFIGTHITEALSATHTVTTLGLDPRNDLTADLTEPLPEFSEQYELVVHAAGTADEARSDAVNRLGTEHLCRALEGRPPRCLVYISSCAVYGASTGLLIPETHALAPATPYGRSKKQAEAMLQSWCRDHGVTLTILRPATVVGTGMTGRVMRMARSIARGSYMHMPGCDASLSWVHAEDVAAACRLLAPLGGVFNLTDGTPHTVRCIADALAFRMGQKRVLTLAPGLMKVVRLAARFHAPLRRTLQRLSDDLTFDNTALLRALPEDYRLTDVVERLHRLALEENGSPIE